MSKFWGADSDSDSGSDSGSSSGIGSDAGGGGGKEKRVWAISSSSSDDEGPREVKSAADKAFEALHAKLKDGKNKIKNNDWVGLQEDFEAINKQVKSKSGIIKSKGVPTAYVRFLIQVEDHLAESLKNAKDKSRKPMSKANARSLNRMKLAVKRHNKDYEQDIAKARENPEADDDSDSSSDGAYSSDGA